MIDPNVRKAARAVLNVYRGADITDALAATGLPRPTWYAWLAPDEQWPNGETRSPAALAFSARLRHAFARAQGLRTVRAQQLLLRAAKSSVGTLDWRAAHEHLKHSEATRKRWHEHKELRVEQVGQVSHEHRLVRDMTTDQLLELASPEIAELVPRDA